MTKDSASKHTPHNPSVLSAGFSKFAQRTALWSGHPLAFITAVVVVLTWVITGPLFNYSDTWQLVINTGTTIVTFLMVFLIQNTQNRDMLAVQLKLSELVLAMKGAQNSFASIEDLTDEELEALHDDCRKRATETMTQIQARRAREAADDAEDAKDEAHAAKDEAKAAAAEAKKPAKTAAQRARGTVKRSR